MRDAMARAEVGDDVLDGDPTTRNLEEQVADLLGHESALFFPTGTQANQTAVSLLVRPGSRLVIEGRAHIVHYEPGAAALISGVQFTTIDTPDGRLSPGMIQAVLEDQSEFYAPIDAVALENAHNYHGGCVLPPDDYREIVGTAERHSLAIHLDGARLWHAAVRLGVTVGDLASPATTVMVSFTKGLGCPVGACLAGPRDLMAEARKVRKRLGGGLRQSGILAAGCLYALDHHLPQLAEDHEKARIFTGLLRDHPLVRIVPPETNIVMIDLVGVDAGSVARDLEAEGVRLSVYGPGRLRAVMHRDQNLDSVRHAARCLETVLNRRQNR